MEETKHPIFLTVPLSHVECKDESFNRDTSNKTDWIFFHVEFKQFFTTKIRTSRGKEVTLKGQTTHVFLGEFLMSDLLDDETEFIHKRSGDMHEDTRIDANVCSYIVPYLTSYAKKVHAERGVDYEDKLIEIKACFSQFVTCTREEVDDSFESSCPICLDDLSARGAECTKGWCSHIFHEFCILRWLDYNNTCPVCRRIIRRYPKYI